MSKPATLAEIIRLGTTAEVEQAWQALAALTAAVDTLRGATNGDRIGAGRAVLEAAKVAAAAYRAAEDAHSEDIAALEAYMSDGERRCTLPENSR